MRASLFPGATEASLFPGATEADTSTARFCRPKSARVYAGRDRLPVLSTENVQPFPPSSSSTSCARVVLDSTRTGELLAVNKAQTPNQSSCDCGEPFLDGSTFCRKCGSRHNHDSQTQFISLLREAMTVICEDVAQASKEMHSLRHDVSAMMSEMKVDVEGIKNQQTKVDADVLFAVSEIQGLRAKPNVASDLSPVLQAVQELQDFGATNSNALLGAIRDGQNVALPPMKHDFDCEKVIQAIQHHRVDVDFSPIMRTLAEQKFEVAAALEENKQHTEDLFISAIKSSVSQTIREVNNHIDFSPILNAIAQSHSSSSTFGHRKTEVDFAPVISAIERKQLAVDLEPIHNCIQKAIQTIKGEVDIVLALEQNRQPQVDRSLPDAIPQQSTAHVDFTQVIAEIRQSVAQVLHRLSSSDEKHHNVDFGVVIGAIQRSTAEIDLALNMNTEAIVSAIRFKNLNVDFTPVLDAIEQGRDAVEVPAMDISRVIVAPQMQMSEIDRSHFTACINSALQHNRSEVDLSPVVRAIDQAVVAIQERNANLDFSPVIDAMRKEKYQVDLGSVIAAFRHELEVSDAKRMLEKSNAQVDLSPVIRAIEHSMNAPVDFAPVLEQLEKNRTEFVTCLKPMIEAMQNNNEVFAGTVAKAIENSSADVDFTPVLEAIQEVHCQIGLSVSPSSDEASQPCLSSILGAIERLKDDLDPLPVLQAVKEQGKELDLSRIFALLQQMTSSLDMSAVIKAIELKTFDSDFSSIIEATIHQSKDDLSAVLEQSKDDMCAVLEAVQQTKTTIQHAFHALDQQKFDVDLSQVLSAIGSVNFDAEFSQILHAIQQTGNGIDIAPVLHAIQKKKMDVDLGPAIEAIQRAEISLANTIQNQKPVLDLSPILATVEHHQNKSMVDRSANQKKMEDDMVNLHAGLQLRNSDIDVIKIGIKDNTAQLSRIFDEVRRVSTRVDCSGLVEEIHRSVMGLDLQGLFEEVRRVPASINNSEVLAAIKEASNDKHFSDIAEEFQKLHCNTEVLRAIRESSSNVDFSVVLDKLQEVHTKIDFSEILHAIEHEQSGGNCQLQAPENTLTKADIFGVLSEIQKVRAKLDDSDGTTKIDFSDVIAEIREARNSVDLSDVIDCVKEVSAVATPAILEEIRGLFAKVVNQEMLSFLTEAIVAIDVSGIMEKLTEVLAEVRQHGNSKVDVSELLEAIQKVSTRIDFSEVVSIVSSSAIAAEAVAAEQEKESTIQRSTILSEIRQVRTTLDEVAKQGAEGDLSEVITALEARNIVEREPGDARTMDSVSRDLGDIPSARTACELADIVGAIKDGNLIVDISGIVDAVERKGDDVIHANTDSFEKIAVILERMCGAVQELKEGVDLPLLEAVQPILQAIHQLKDNVVDLSPVIKAIEDLSPVIKAIERNQVDVDHAPIIAAIQNGVHVKLDLNPILAAIREYKPVVELDDAPVIRAIQQMQTRVDFTPIIAAIQQNKAQVDVSPIINAIQQIQTKIDIRPVLDAIHQQGGFVSGVDMAPVLKAVHGHQVALEQIREEIHHMKAEV